MWLILLVKSYLWKFDFRYLYTMVHGARCDLDTCLSFTASLKEQV